MKNWWGYCSLILDCFYWNILGWVNLPYSFMWFLIKWYIGVFTQLHTSTASLSSYLHGSYNLCSLVYVPWIVTRHLAQHWVASTKWDVSGTIHLCCCYSQKFHLLWLVYAEFHGVCTSPVVWPRYGLQKTCKCFLSWSLNLPPSFKRLYSSQVPHLWILFI